MVLKRRAQALDLGPNPGPDPDDTSGDTPDDDRPTGPRTRPRVVKKRATTKKRRLTPTPTPRPRPRPTPTPAFTTPRGLADTGFKRVTSEVPTRLIALVGGETNSGRTHLCLTAPGPIAYQGIEMGDEGVKEQFVSDKVVMSSHYIAKTITRLDQSNVADKKKSQEEARDLFYGFVRDYVAALKSPDVRTIVWDTGSQLGELSRVAAFGKLTKIMPRDWTDQKYEFNKIVQMAYDYNKNFLVVAKLGPVYVGDQRTKDLEPKGMSDVLYLFPTVIRTYSETEDSERVHWYEVQKVKGAGNAHLLEKVYEAPENELKYLWADMFDRDPDEWR